MKESEEEYKERWRQRYQDAANGYADKKRRDEIKPRSLKILRWSVVIFALGAVFYWLT